MKSTTRRKQMIGAAAFILAALLLLPAAAARDASAESAPYVPAAQIAYDENREDFENYEGFLRIDGDTVEATEGELQNARFITEGEYALGEAQAKYNLDPDYEVSTEGLDTLNISASAQFSESQFRDLAEELRRLAGDKRVVIVDLRGESHCLLNGIPVSWMEMNNWDNFGLTLEEIEANEAERFDPLVGQTVQLCPLAGGAAGDPVEITVETVMYEKELVESEGFEYLRLDCVDHSFPTPDEIETFIEYVQSLDPENTWLHFHCGAGKGRTGIFMMIYDKMMNPEVSDQDIMYRHAKMGASYPLYTSPGSFNGPMYAEKSEMTPLLFQYIEENAGDDYSVSWSEWLTAHLQ